MPVVQLFFFCLLYLLNYEFSLSCVLNCLCVVFFVFCLLLRLIFLYLCVDSPRLATDKSATVSWQDQPVSLYLGFRCCIWEGQEGLEEWDMALEISWPTPN